jgi:glycerol-3-phosphate dehydrogenase
MVHCVVAEQVGLTTDPSTMNSYSVMRREALSTGFSAVEAARIDLLVVGGGITGACIALEAALRGLDVVLVERDDFGSGATANCLKIVHGGLRYLQHLDLRRVRRSAVERSVWLRSAPHLVEPLPVVMPSYRGRFPSRAVLSAAMAVNEAFSADRNRGMLADRRIPVPRLLSRSDAVQMEPSLAHPALSGGVLFHDALMYSPERLTLEVVDAARAAGAVVANHVEFVEALVEGGRVAGARLRDVLQDRTTEVRTRWIVNATGSSVPALVQHLGRRSTPQVPSYSVAMNLVTRCPAPRFAYAAVTTADPCASSSVGGRQLFVIPWRDQMMIGTAHFPWSGDLDGFQHSGEQVQRFVEEMATARPSIAVDPDQIVLVHSGLLPVSEARRPGELRLLKDHRILDHTDSGCKGAFSVISVKLTTARAVAREVLDHIAPLRKARVYEPAARLPLPGGSFDSLDTLRSEAWRGHGAVLPEDVLEHLVRTYGARYDAVLEHRKHVPDWHSRVVPEAPVIRAQLYHGAVAEYAQTADDLIWRRTELGPRGLAGPAARQAAEEVLAFVKSESSGGALPASAGGDSPRPVASPC